MNLCGHDKHYMDSHYVCMKCETEKNDALGELIHAVTDLLGAIDCEGEAGHFDACFSNCITKTKTALAKARGEA